MHEFHSTKLSATELESYPLPENYTKKAEVKINDNAENSLQENINEIVSPNENTNIDVRQERKRLRFKYHCDECNQLYLAFLVIFLFGLSSCIDV
jgi:protein-arginine kinase activator protein McsA